MPDRKNPLIGPTRLPERVVALGGGTGLPAVLRGLRRFVSDGDVTALTAVVCMTDDGGSSGRLRESHGMPPPGDTRNCLVALSGEDDLLSNLFQHRYESGTDLAGHSLGNLILAALSEQTGSFLKAVEMSSRVLRTAGRILPATLEDVRLVAELDDGGTIAGESAIGTCDRRIRQVRLVPESAQPTPGVLESIIDADLVVLGPGSLFTSLLPTLVVDGVADALKRSRAARVLVGNLVSEHGESSGLTLAEHIAAIEDHAGSRIVDAVLAHRGPIASDVVERYRVEGAKPLALRDAPIADGVRVVPRDLIAPGRKLRHDPGATADGLLEAWRRVTTDRNTHETGPAEQVGGRGA